MLPEDNMATNEVRYIPLYNQWRNYTLKDFVQRAHIFAANTDGSEKKIDDVVKDLFDYNKELIFSQMTEDDKKDFAFYKATGSYPDENDKSDRECFEQNVKDNYPTSADDLDKNMILPYPCKLRIDSHCITSELMISQTNFQEMEDDFYAFEDEYIAGVLDEEDVSGEMFSKSQPKCTVLLWSRSYLLNEDTGGQVVSDSGIWTDLSKYVISVTTNVAQQGGNFSISLPLYDSGIRRQVGVAETITRQNVATYNNSGIERKKFLRIQNNKSDKYSEIYSHVSTNDLIFISFAGIDELDKKTLDGSEMAEIISNSNFDMIGLVDNVTISRSYSGAQGTTNINGRDLSKLLIDDGSFFFNPSTTVAPSAVFFNEQGYAKQGDIREVDKMNGKYQAINRLRRSSGELDIFRNQPNQTISYVIKGVLSQLANIEIVPSDTFKLWDNRTKWVEMHPDEEIVKEEVPKTPESNEETEIEINDSSD